MRSSCSTSMASSRPGTTAPPGSRATVPRKSSDSTSASSIPKTPLKAILGWTQLLRSRGASEKAELARAMEIIERNARAQVRLIDDLLDLSRIMSGRVRLDVQQVSLGDIVRSALDSIEPAARTKG